MADEQSKADNSLNNQAEEAAWDAEVIPGCFKRVFISGNHLLCVVVRRPGSVPTKEDRWSLEYLTKQELQTKAGLGWTVELVLVDETMNVRGKYNWTQLMFVKTDKYWLVWPA